MTAGPPTIDGFSVEAVAALVVICNACGDRSGPLSGDVDTLAWARNHWLDHQPKEENVRPARTS